ncbi:LacI family DNA-binding transcriptional regulator [Gorillibacterium massiliense]|uniref:LacI family DNA-binding transcriptional regulator n=1 Tax=Gorillibacterium massiliense TaxID=1280390 RepID=UPI0004BA1D98|nr:LacI family DNA-binding transcriptional regulator [Gorillibacterium massiliense]
MATIYDIAKRTGYSPATVSKAFNHYSDISRKTRDHILNTAREMGYLPNTQARALTTKRSWTIGLLFLEKTGVGLRHPFFGGVLEGFKQTAATAGYDLLFLSKDIGGKANSYLEHGKMRGVDGVAVLMYDAMDADYAELLRGDLPCVVLDSDTEAAVTLASDNAAGSRQAIDYLYGLGHRKIAHIAGGRGTFAGTKRREGFEQGVSEHGLELRPEWVVEAHFDYSVESGYRAMEELLRAEERPTAVFAAGDNLAVGAIQAAQAAGLHVPDDISVIGYDDIELARYLTPSLTTVRQDMAGLGARAAQLLIHAIENGGSKEAVIHPVELVVRQSCREPNRG